MSLARIRRAFKMTKDRGASAVEYGLMVAAIAAVIVGVVFALGGFVRAAFDKTCSAIQAGASVRSDPACPAGGGSGGGASSSTSSTAG